MYAEAAARDRRQRIDHQARTKIGTADADADDVGDARGRQRVDQRGHRAARLARQRGRGLGAGRGGEIAAQCRMQCSATFGGIDDRAIDQASHRTRQVRVVREREQGLECLPVVTLARETGV
jgi:hypothetical protein